METGFLDGIMIIFTKGFNFPFFIYIYMYWDGYIEMGKRATDNNGFQNYTRIDQYR
jgi:hypothetical protein